MSADGWRRHGRSVESGIVRKQTISNGKTGGLITVFCIVVVVFSFLCIVIADVSADKSYSYAEATDFNIQDAIAAMGNAVNPPVYQQMLMVDYHTYIALADGSPARVTIYRNATDPNYGQLIVFLLNDDDEDTVYTPGQYVCTNYAVDLADDAEQQGIRAHVVYVRLFDGGMYTDHMCNAFYTTDRGWVYVDDTGNTAEAKALRAPGVDCIVDLHVGSDYTPVMLVKVPGWTKYSMGTVVDYKILD